MPNLGTRANSSARAYGLTSAKKLVVPPTFVNQGSNGGTSNTISFTMPTRQSGDVAIITFNAYYIPGANPAAQGANAANWTRVFNTYSSFSILNEDQGVYNTVIHRQTYHRVMNNTTSDNFSYTLPQSMIWTAQYLIVRPAPGTTYTATGGEFLSQTGSASLFGAVNPPSNSWFRVLSIAANDSPKSLIITNNSNGLTVNSGPNYAIGTLSSSYTSSLTNSVSMTRSILSGTSSSGYIASFVDPLINAGCVGQFSRVSGNTNYSYHNSFGLLVWSNI